MPKTFQEFEDKNFGSPPKGISKYGYNDISYLLWYQTVLESEKNNAAAAVTAVVRACFFLKLHEKEADFYSFDTVRFKKDRIYDQISTILNKIPALSRENFDTLNHAFWFTRKIPCDAMVYEKYMGQYYEEEIKKLYKEYPLKMFWCDMANNPATTADKIIQKYNRMIIEFYKNDSCWTFDEIELLDNFAANHSNIVFAKKHSRIDYTAKGLLSLITREMILESVFSKKIQNDPVTGKLLERMYADDKVILYGYGLDRRKDAADCPRYNATDVKMVFPLRFNPEN